MINPWISTLLLLTLTTCKKEDRPADQEIRNVSYGNHPQQGMDVYLPAGRNRAATKSIVLIHGGAWSSGDKSEFDGYVETIKDILPGYAIFNINYRLATISEFPFPTQEQDVKAAIDYISAKSDEYSVSGKMVLLGASAGAHLALLHAYKNPDPQKIAAVVDFFGPTDLTTLYNGTPNPMLQSLLSTLLGGTPSGNSSGFQQSSPLQFANPGSAPTIIFQGGLDPLVPPSQSTALRDKLEANSVPNKYVFYPNEGHGWTGNNLAHSFNEIKEFLASHVH